jgi:acyl-CoA thioester hydrolase
LSARFIFVDLIIESKAMEINGFKFKTRIQLRFKDTDQMGHVNNANHLTYFELARVAYFNEVIAEKIEWNKEGIILARIEVDYKSPVLLEDEVWVHIRLSKIGRTSFDMEYKIVRINGNVEVIAAEGKSVQVCFNYELNKPIPVPESWKVKALNFEPAFHSQ